MKKVVIGLSFLILGIAGIFLLYYFDFYHFIFSTKNNYSLDSNSYVNSETFFSNISILQNMIGEIPDNQTYIYNFFELMAITGFVICILEVILELLHDIIHLFKRK